MADDGSAQSQTVWPLPKFYFKVTTDSLNASFQEVTGLDTEAQPIEYRHGDNPIFAPIKMPGMARVGNVTLRKGVFVKDNKFFDWYAKIKMNTIKRETVVIELLDESGAPTMKWTLNNAWPTKVTGTDLKSDGNEVAVETIEVAYETIKIENS